MTRISTTQLSVIMPASRERIPIWVEPLNETMDEFGIVNPARQAAFLAQIAHESAELQWLKEKTDGSEYEGRADLGNRFPGDGAKFIGRGLLQITGRDNYQKASDALGVDFIANPDLLLQPRNAARSAGWFWKMRGLNELADQGRFGSITRAINGGYNGLDSRLGYWVAARRCVGL